MLTIQATHSELVDALIELLLTPDDVWNNKNRRRRHDQEVKPEQLTRLSAGLRMAQKEEKKAMRVRHPVTLPGDMAHRAAKKVVTKSHPGRMYTRRGELNKQESSDQLIESAEGLDC